MKNQVGVVVSLLIGMLAGAGLMLASIMKPNKPVKAEVPVPRFQVICRETPNTPYGDPLIVLHDTLYSQDYLAFRGGLVLLGKGTNVGSESGSRKE